MSPHVSVVLVLAASMIAGGCGHQGGTGGNQGGSAGNQDGSGPMMCKGVYADKTVDQLDLRAWCAGGGGTGCPGGACQGPDEVAVCANDINGTATACGISCNAPGASVSTKVACTSSCMKKALNPVPSDACLSCYSDNVGCALDYCGTPCLTSPDKYCTQLLYDCTGLPVPTGLNLNAVGASNSGGATGGGSTGGRANGGASSGGGSHGGAAGGP